MKSKIIAAALLAGLAGPAAASTLLDFTKSGIGVGNTSDTVFGVTYNITASGGDLSDATHKNNVGCDVGYNFACDAVGDRFDVGFGVMGQNGPNDNEVDGINGEEYVQVAFDSLVWLRGFAGMLTYDGSQNGEGTEQVALEYSADGGSTWSTLLGNTMYDDAAPGTSNDTFGTVGLSYLDGIFGVQANMVRFKAYGESPFDDGNANITAAALEVSEVPIPAGGLLLVSALGGFAALRRRKAAA
ncbi:MAG: VPLPA-CTERM sorting domain-containing protein [Pseudooceanicola sp.]